MIPATLPFEQFQRLQHEFGNGHAHLRRVLQNAHSLRGNEPQARSAGNGSELNVRADADSVVQQRGQQHHQQDQCFVQQAFERLAAGKPAVLRLVRFPHVYYHDNAYWPAHAPHGFWLRYGSFLDDCMTEWAFRQHELRIGLITKEEYFEWKINWPETSDDCGKRIPYKDWRKQPEEDRQKKELDTLRRLLPKRDNDLDSLPNLQRLSDEQLAPLVPDLLEWLRDPQNRMARYVSDLLGERREMMIPIVEKIMAGEDEELKFGIRMELIPRMEKWVWKIRY